MAITVLKVNGKLKVVERVPLRIPLAGLDQVSIAPTAIRCDHFTPEPLTNRHGAAETLQVIISIDIGNHQAHRFITVDQIVKHDRRAAGDRHPRPAGRIEEGVTAIRTLEGVQTGSGTTTGAEREDAQQNEQGPERTSQHGAHGEKGRMRAFCPSHPLPRFSPTAKEL